MAQLGLLQEFREGADWSDFVDRLDQYFIANQLDGPDEAGRRRAVLLTVCGSQAYALMKDLLAPAKPTDKSYDALTTLLKEHYKPKAGVIISRYKFYTHRRREDQAISSYVAELRHLAEPCDFGASLESMLRDFFVMGIQDSAILKKLLAEGDTLTLSRAIKIAQACVTTEDNLREISSHSKTSTANVHRVQSTPRTTRTQPATNTRQDNQRSGDTGRCWRCGGRHNPRQCRFATYSCNKCGTVGHLQRACKSTQSTAVRVLHSDLPNDSGGEVPDKKVHDTVVDSCDSELYSLYRVTPEKSLGSPIMIPLHISGMPLEMELDTGACKTIMSEDTFKSLWSAHGKEAPHLHSVVEKLRTYTNHVVPVLGSVDVQVRYNGVSKQLPLWIVEGNGPTLLGRNWLPHLDLKVSHINHCATVNVECGKVMEKFKSVFEKGIGVFRGCKMKLHVDEKASPIFHKARSVPYMMREHIENELDRLEREGIITPVEFSDWACPIVPVVKSDGGVRICGDYKTTINRFSKLDRYPLPKADDLLASLGGGSSFTKLDLTSAYAQMELDDDSKRYTCINTHKGLFVYNRCPFGVRSAAPVFQRYMENLLKSIPHTVVFQDDVLVTGKTDDEHLRHLEEVLRRFESVGLRVKESKCKFMVPVVQFLGRKVTADGILPTDSMTEAIRKAPLPKNVSELRAFLGMLNYYGNFLPNLSTVLEPLHMLLRKDCPWIWSREQNEAFSEAKRLLVSSPLLVHFDPSKRHVLSCDSSSYGIGCVLHQNENGKLRPVAFASRTLSAPERNYSMVEKEALACVFGVKKMHQYLYGRSFELETDHKPLMSLLGEDRGVSPNASGRIQRWALLLAGYDYTIRYKPGGLNVSADALSRLPLPHSPAVTPQLPEILTVKRLLDDANSPVTAQQIGVWSASDPVMSHVKRCILTGNWVDVPEGLVPFMKPYLCRKNELSVHGNCLVWGSRVVIPPDARSKLLSLLHDSHPGVVMMKAIARCYVWWPNIDRDLESCVRQCTTCQEMGNNPPKSQLHPWAWPERPWSRIHLDFAGPFQGKMLFIVIDAHSKWIECELMHSITSSSTIETLRTTFARYGLPDTVVTDNGPSFTSYEFQTFMKNNGIRHLRSAPFRPASNGQAEVAVRIVKEGLKRVEGVSLQTRLSRFLLSYRTRPHSVTGKTPAELLMRRELKTILSLVRPSVKDRVKLKQEKQKDLYDRTSVCRSISINDAVYVLNFSTGPKWLPGFVTDTLGPNMLEVLLLDGKTVRRHLDHTKIRQGGVNVSPESDGDNLEMESLPLTPTVPDTGLPKLGDYLVDCNPTQDNQSAESIQPAEPSPTRPEQAVDQPVLRRSSRIRKAPDRLQM